MTAVVDKESVTKIVSNLLNNALKYAKKEIQGEVGEEMMIV